MKAHCIFSQCKQFTKTRYILTTQTFYENAMHSHNAITLQKRAAFSQRKHFTKTLHFLTTQTFNENMLHSHNANNLRKFCIFSQQKHFKKTCSQNANISQKRAAFSLNTNILRKHGVFFYNTTEMFQGDNKMLQNIKINKQKNSLFKDHLQLH